MDHELNASRNKNTGFKSGCFRILKLLMAVGIFGYLGILVTLVLQEDALVFKGSKYPRGNWQPSEFAFEEVTYRAEDGAELVSWFLPAPTHSSDARPMSILLFHGNAENVAQISADLGRMLQSGLQANVLVAEYRGYGKSSGEPNESGVLKDAEAARDYLCQRTNCKPRELVIVGSSLGGAPACYLAGKSGCAALVLDKTFDSLVAVAQKEYPIFPVKYLMRNTFRSDLWIQSYQGPLLMMHGDRDTLIPLEQAKNLFEQAPSTRKKFHVVSNWGHWDPYPGSYWPVVFDFLKTEL